MIKEEKQREACRKWRENNPDYASEHYILNREKQLAQNREYYRENKEIIKTRRAKWREENRELLREKGKKYYLDNKQACKERSSLNYQKDIELSRKNKREYNRANKDSLSAARRDRRHTDLNFKLACNLRTRLGQAILANAKVGSAVADLGCSIGEFKLYIEHQFQEGMTWDNWGDWHLDHVLPLASFDLTDRMEFLEACNWLNMQPLWAGDNMRKGAKV